MALGKAAAVWEQGWHGMHCPDQARITAEFVIEGAGPGQGATDLASGRGLRRVRGNGAAAYLYAALSRACHYHPYELAPTAAELTGWLDQAAHIVTQLQAASTVPAPPGY